MAIVFLAPTEIYFAALGPDSLSLTEPPHPTSKEKKDILKFVSITFKQEGMVAQW